MINFNLYWNWVRLKVFYQRKRNAIKKHFQKLFKRYCRCSYSVKPGRGEVICQTCKGWQKHSGWQ